MRTSSSSSVAEDDVCQLERVRCRRVPTVRVGEHAHPGCVRRPQPVRGVLDRRTALRRDAEPACRLEVHVGRGLAARDLLRRDRRPEQVGDPRCAEHGVDQRSVRGGRDRERESRGRRSNRVHGSRDHRQVGPIPLEHPRDDLGVDLLGRLGEPDGLVHVPGPLRRAHPHHRALVVRAVPTASFVGQALADLVPDVLAVDEHPVHVENDRRDRAHARDAVRQHEDPAGGAGSPVGSGQAQTALQRPSPSVPKKVFCSSCNARSRGWSYRPSGVPCHMMSGIRPGPMIVARYFEPAPIGCAPCG